MRAKAKPIIFADRDGTLIAEKDYPGDPRTVKLIAGTIRGLKTLRRAGYPVVVITNQSGIGRGILTRLQVARVQRRFLSLLRKNGARVSGYYLCPHAPQAKCACRKPKLGLLKRASKELGRSWKKSISIGDKLSDVSMGKRTGGIGILVRTGHGRDSSAQRRKVQPDFIARNFYHGVQWILRNERKLT